MASATPPARYTGRFAPSPTGPLHFGSLIAAVASYLQAKSNNGRWLVRIEDIDPPREPPGSDQLILAALESHGFEWDGAITFQSQFRERHEELLQHLVESGLAYPCRCSRRDLANAPRGPLGTIYPGTCRTGCTAPDVAIRLRTDDEPIVFDDRLQGKHSQRLQSESGDFIIKRRDGLIAYHLAVVVDDFDQGITEIVRGVDLLDSTPRQIWLQRCLGFSEPGYVHVPVAENSDGQKLSKLTGAPAIPTTEPSATLCDALDALAQEPPLELRKSALCDLWEWAIEHWDISTLRGQKSIPADRYPLAGGENGLS